jgi:hypothetical protein
MYQQILRLRQSWRIASPPPPLAVLAASSDGD